MKLIFIILLLNFYFNIFANNSIYSSYSEILKKYVNNKGLVNYKELKKNRIGLDNFINKISKLKKLPNNKKQQLSFWINVYNAITLRSIIDNYPIRSSWFGYFSYPKNSIRQISGVWNKTKWNIMGKKLTLDNIEHQILRKKFNEPRVHMCIVCASIGCPILRNEIFENNKLEQQLEDQSKRFLADPSKFKIDKKKKIIYLSKIFKWFPSDFIKKYSTEYYFKNRKKNIKAVLNFIKEHISKNNRKFLLKNNFKIKYLKYNWSLNEQ